MTSQHPKQPSTDEQSGSAGRRTHNPAGQNGEGKDTGQGRYGQSAVSKKPGPKTAGQANYQDAPDGGEREESDSNQGSGRSDQIPEDQRRPRGKD